MVIRKAFDGSNEHPLEDPRVQKQIYETSDATYASFRFSEHDRHYERVDLHSEVEEKFLKNPDSLSPELIANEVALRKLIRVVTVNVARSEWRKMTRRPRRGNSGDIETFPLRDPSPGPEKNCACAELLGLLPEQTRRVLVLKHQGYTFQEIGDQLGCSHTAARIKFKKGIQMIKQLLQGQRRSA